ncbi:MAG: hypothetical protein NC344_09900 [Bacteroidales bacterium]|nr:hypothetical protein [Bacteroidales bacterium]MCM1148117.1 hypothetical protein [Bacteroidales bacterium]MCM1206533.1 hypothetical protein [Bacillota bacterium]MCM1510565.1 hypothetical protein [Clostridium sp.]
MKKKILNAVRVMVMLVALVLGILGYVCYERTLVDWWLPVLVAVVIAVVTVPLMRGRWSWLVGEDRTFDLLCHLYVTGCLAYFLFLCGNYFLASKESMHEETVTVEERKHTTRDTGYRSGRRYRRSGRQTHSYYLSVRLEDGSLKDMPVTSKYYSRVRTGGTIDIRLQDGAFGFRVIKGK